MFFIGFYFYFLIIDVLLVSDVAVVTDTLDEGKRIEDIGNEDNDINNKKEK